MLARNLLPRLGVKLVLAIKYFAQSLQDAMSSFFNINRTLDSSVSKYELRASLSPDA